MEKALAAWQRECVIETGADADAFTLGAAMASLRGWCSVEGMGAVTASREQVNQQLTLGTRVRWDSHTKRFRGARLG